MDATAGRRTVTNAVLRDKRSHYSNQKGHRRFTLLPDRSRHDRRHFFTVTFAVFLALDYIGLNYIVNGRFSID